MVSSTDIPKAILNTRIVDGLTGIAKSPIIPAVTIKGIKLGTKEIITIRQERNKKAINRAIINTAMIKLVNRFLMRYCVPSAATTEVPVTKYRSEERRVGKEYRTERS